MQVTTTLRAIFIASFRSAALALVACAFVSIGACDREEPTAEAQAAANVAEPTPSTAAPAAAATSAEPADRTEAVDREVAQFVCQRVALLASANRGVVSERELLLDVGRRANREFSDRPDARASLASAMGRACADHGDLVHAEELLTGAIAQQSATIGDDARGTLRSRSALARVLFRSGRIEESRRSMGPLLAACKRRLADTDPVALEVLVLQVRLELDAPTTPRESERLAWTALSFVRSASDVPARTVARAYGNLARALALSGRFEEADRAAERAISEATCALGPMHPVTLEMSVCRGTLLNVAGRPADADDVLGAALDQQEHRLGKTHPSRLPALRELLRAQALSGRGEDAKVTARELLAVVHAQPQLDAMIAKHASAEAEAILTPSSRARDAGG